MAKSEPHPSFPRLSRFSLGRASRRTPAKQNEDDTEDWYIPYHGPYEKRKNSPELQPRDSWGDLINAYADDAILGDPDLHSRYENHHDELLRDDNNHSDLDRPRTGRTSNRVVSAISHQTASSSAVDPSRRSTVSRSTGQRHQASSYVDVAGGVGESPTPPQRLVPTCPRTNNGNRGIANLFGNTRKPGTPPSKAPHNHDPDARLSQPKSLYSLLRSNSSSEGKRDNHNTRNRRENSLAVDTHFTTSLAATTDDAYYDSYYSTLLSSPKGDHFPVPFPQTDTVGHPFAPSSKYQGRHLVDVPSSINSPTSISSRPLAIHPYAQTFPATALTPRPQTAPPSAVRHQFQDPGPSNQPRQRILLTGPKHSRGGPLTPLSKPSALNPPQPLKSSISSPDLYAASRRVDNPQVSNAKASSSTSKDRWLSIETWCDAILFPRPKFQLNGKENCPIISPPGSPIMLNHGENGANHKKNMPGIQSRVLLHSRSHTELRPSTVTGSSSNPMTARRRGATLPSSIPFAEESPDVDGATAGLVKPKTSGQDDVVPSPVPSLVRVLEEGHRLDEMRKQWQAQATQSFQNKRTRSISRTRSKSLTSGNPMTGRKEGEVNKVMESLDFLATRSFLGNQSMMPTVVLPKTAQRVAEKNTGVGTFSSNSNSNSHSHSNSLNKNSSKSSKGSFHRSHSRNASWGQSALKIAKSTAASLCGFSDTSLSTPPDEKTSALEGELRGVSTQLISMGDQESKPLLSRNAAANDIISFDTKADIPSNPSGVSPVPSANFEGVGIALSTPPPDDRLNPSDTDPISLPDHPYGQSGLYSRPQTAPTVSYRLRDSWRGSDYAGPHPSLPQIVAHGDPNDVSARHRLPPQAILHPYAQATTSDNRHAEDRMKGYLRADSQVPPRDKMWAQLSPSGLREILPSDIVYSPYDKPPVYPSDEEDAQKGCSTVSVGEALTSTMRGGTRDSGLGTSEGHEIMYPLPIINLEGTVQEEPEDRVVQRHGEDTTTTAPLQVGRLRHPYGTTFLEPVSQPVPTASESTLDSPQAENGQSSGSSPGVPSQSSSPQISPRPLGSMDDLDHFRDLFYKPASARTSGTELAMTMPATSRGSALPWEIRSHRTGSGLTSLARKLSEELEELNAQMEPSERASIGGASSDQFHGGLRFVLAETRDPSERVSSLRLTTDRDKLTAFRPSDNIPEDVESSRASSFMQHSPVEDENSTVTEPVRVGVVESLATPAATTSPRPISGHLSLVDEESVSPGESSNPHSRIRSQPSLPPPSAEATRSSYMTTTSTNGSRMSGLSDFPVPPADIVGHMKLLDTFFETPPAEVNEVPPQGSPPAPASRRMTFGGDEDIEDIAKALSYP